MEDSGKEATHYHNTDRAFDPPLLSKNFNGMEMKFMHIESPSTTLYSFSSRPMGVGASGISRVSRNFRGISLLFNMNFSVEISTNRFLVIAITLLRRCVDEISISHSILLLPLPA